MKNLEGNKIVAAILVAGLTAMIIGKVANFLYQSHETDQKRGYQIEVAEETTDGQNAATQEAAPIDIPVLMAAANAAEGEKLFKKCASCHIAAAGAPHRVGPNLHGVVNAAKGHHADFAYSDALKSKGGNWDYASLFEFLKKPRDYVPGTKMSFAGLRNPEDIANVIKYLEHQ